MSSDNSKNDLPNIDEMDRRQAIRALAFGPPLTSLVPLTAQVPSGYSPRFLSAAELDLLATLGELILPRTDTPGAREAKAHEHIDLVLSEEAPEIQLAFRGGLQWVERLSHKTYGKQFLALDQHEQNGILQRMADSKTEKSDKLAEGGFFRDLRARVVFAYYTSEIGLRQELNYQGKQVLGHWPGCPHSDRHGDSE